MSKDVTFFQDILFFSTQKTSFQGENIGEKEMFYRSPYSISILSYIFDYGGGPIDVGDKWEKELKVYSRTEKQQENDKLSSQALGEEASLDPFPESGIASLSSVSPSVLLLR